MGLLVDASVWSLAYRRDTPPDLPEIQELRRALGDGVVVSTGMILLELLRGFVPERAQDTIRAAFDTLELLEPSRLDYVEAADVAKACRCGGVQLSNVDALIVRLALVGDHTLLSTDDDFRHAARIVPLRVWRPVGDVS